MMSLTLEFNPQKLINHVLIMEKSGLPVFYRQYNDETPMREEEQVLITGLLGGFINFSESLDLGEIRDVGFSGGRWFFYKIQDNHYLTICFNTNMEETKLYTHEQLSQLAQYLFDKLSMAFALFWNMENSVMATLDDEELNFFQQNFGQALDQIISEMAYDFQLSDSQRGTIIDLEKEELIGNNVVHGKTSSDISGLRRHLAQRLKKLLNGS